MSESGYTIKNGFNRSTESSNGLAGRKFTRTLETLPITRGPLAAKKEDETCSYLLLWCGEKGRDITNTWSDVTEDDKKKLKTYFRPEASGERLFLQGAPRDDP